jgi:hypothetical protein
MEIEVEWEEEVQCPKCKHKFWASGITYAEIEPSFCWSDLD